MKKKSFFGFAAAILLAAGLWSALPQPMRAQDSGIGYERGATQTERILPPSPENRRINNRSMIKGRFAYPTYMVGSGHAGIRSRIFPININANPMTVSYNGIIIKRNYYQNNTSVNFMFRSRKAAG